MPTDDLRDRIAKVLEARVKASVLPEALPYSGAIGIASFFGATFYDLADAALAAIAAQAGGEAYDRIVTALAEEVPADEYSPDSAASVAFNAMLPALANLDIENTKLHGDLVEVMRIVTAWCIEFNDVGGVDAGDLAWRLEEAGYPLPDPKEEADRG